MISAERACELIKADYAGQLAPLIEPYREWGIAATIIEEPGFGNILVIRGTDAADDWWRYNLRAWPAKGNTLWFHRGFLDVARKVEAWVMGARAMGLSVGTVVGHSKGSAAGQIVSLPSSLDMVGWVFGSPRPVYRWGKDVERLGLKHVIHGSDPVRKRLRRAVGGAWIGEVRIYGEEKIFGSLEAHGIDAYLKTCRTLRI